jgi:hypothetical protein
VNRRRAREGGQAVVEITLAIIVFITVLLFGIHFTEITFTQMKVTEAAQAAIWESTSGTMHVLPRPIGNFTDVNTRVDFAVNDAMARYADFDGSLTGAGLPKQLFSQARAGSMNIRCRTNVGFNQSGAGLLLTPYQALVYDDNGGLECTSEAYIDSGGVSKIGKFLEGTNGLFNASHQTSVTQGTAGYHVCGLNKSDTTNGPCRGSFKMLIDDWGLASGGSENKQCPVLPYGLPCVGGNLNFWTAADLIYQANSVLFFTTSGADYRLLQRIVGSPFWPGGNAFASAIPGNPTSFYMGFCGEDPSLPTCTGLFTEFTPWHGDGSWWVWQTTPFAMWPQYGIAYATSSGCYLGQDCTSTANSP